MDYDYIHNTAARGAAKVKSRLTTVLRFRTARTKSGRAVKRKRPNCSITLRTWLSTPLHQSNPL